MPHQLPKPLFHLLLHFILLEDPPYHPPCRAPSPPLQGLLGLAAPPQTSTGIAVTPNPDLSNLLLSYLLLLLLHEDPPNHPPDLLLHSLLLSHLLLHLLLEDPPYHPPDLLLPNLTLSHQLLLLLLDPP